MLSLAYILLSQAQKPPVAPAPRIPKAIAVPLPVGEPATLEALGAWDGWKYLDGAAPQWTLRPSAFSTPLPESVPENPQAAVFKLKVFLLKRSEAEFDALGTTEDAALASLSGAGEARARTAVANLDGLIRRATGGRVRLEISLTFDEEPIGIEPSTVDRTPNPNSERLGRYLSLRVNGGRFDAEDGVDRGPYSGVLVIAPQPTGPLSPVANTPVAGVGFYAAGGELAGSALEARLFGAVVGLIGERLNLNGVATSNQEGAADAWTQAPVSSEGSLAPLRAGIGIDAAALANAQSATVALPILATAGRLPYVAPAGVWIETDPERGAVIRYREAGSVRLGGFTLPKISTGGKPNLAFWVRRTGTDPVALRWVGTQTVTTLGPSGTVTASVPVPGDGKWRRIVVSAAPGGVLTIEPPIADVGRFRRDASAVDLTLDDFELTDDPITPTVPPTRGGEAVSPSSGTGDAGVLLRILNANLGDEAALTALVSDINPMVARAAARRLGELKTPTAIATLRRVLNVGPTEAARQEAARQLAKTADPALIPVVAILLGRTSWRSRLAAVESLGLYRAENAIRFRLSATLQENPELRYAALLPATLDNPDERQKLLYAAINDPSDVIRALACDRLLDAKEPAVLAEGLRGVADDSPWVRVLMQRSLARRKDPAFREAILKGIVDPIAEVRAEAIRALGTLGPLNLADLGATLNDPHPLVLIALREEARAGRITLPEPTRALLAASRDPRVNPRS